MQNAKGEMRNTSISLYQIVEKTESRSFFLFSLLFIFLVGCDYRNPERSVHRLFGMPQEKKSVETVVIGHRNPDLDTIASAIAYANLKRELGMKHVIAARCGELNERIQFVLKKFGFQEPVLMYDVSSQKEKVGATTPDLQKIVSIKRRLILVDHNDMMQAVQGAAKLPIVEIIDHHRISTIKTEKPILFLNCPVGSTCTIVTKCYQQSGVHMSKAMAGLLMSGLIYDTLNLTSPTTTETDHEVMSYLQRVSGQDPSKLAEEIFSIGSPLETTGPTELVESHAKRFEAQGYQFALAHIVEVDHLELVKQREQALLQALNQYRRDHRLFFVALLVTDVKTHNSLMLVEGDAEVLSKIDYPKITQNMWKLDGIVSFKEQLFPYFSRLLQQMKKENE